MGQKVPSSFESEEGWRSEASCRDSDPDLFFPVGTTGAAIEQIANAKAICVQCVAQTACLEYALETNIEHGIWGGTSEYERAQILKKSRNRAS